MDDEVIEVEEEEEEHDDEDGIPEEEEAGRMLEEDEEEEEGSVQRLCRLMSNTLFLGFEAHVKALEQAREQRREALAFKSAVEEDAAMVDEGAVKKTQDELDGLGVWMPGDKYNGDINMRTLQKLLARVDARGFERSAQQLEFHQAFMKAAARVIYKGDWETDRPMIMEKYGWERCNSEVLIRSENALERTQATRITNRARSSCPAQHAAPLREDLQHSHLLRLSRDVVWLGDCRLQSSAPRQPQAPGAGAR